MSDRGQAGTGDTAVTVVMLLVFLVAIVVAQTIHVATSAELAANSQQIETVCNVQTACGNYPGLAAALVFAAAAVLHTIRFVRNHV